MDVISDAWSLDLFKLNESSDDDGNLGKDYSVEIKTPKRFSLQNVTFALGASFRIAAQIVQLLCVERRLRFFGECSDIMASNYAAVACFVSLLIIAEALNETCGLSIALDCSMLHETSYLDVRFRFFLNDETKTFHVLAVHLFNWHTGQIMLAMLVKFLNPLYAEWQKLLVGITIGGDRLMTGRIQRVLMRLSVGELLELYAFLCGLYQFDLLMQRANLKSLDEDFFLFWLV